MSLLGILFRQSNVVIGAKSSRSTNIAGAVLDELKSGLVNTWDAATTKGIVVDCTVSENHNFTCDMTEEPVEQGAKITDHVQLKPKQLTIEGVISDAPLGYAIVGNIQNIVKTVASVFGGSVRSIDAFNELEKLQESRVPFTVITGLKRYENMIMVDFDVQRTAETGRALHFKAIMRQIRIVQSQTGMSQSLSDNVSNIASKTQDFGQKVTDAVPAATDIENNESIAHGVARTVSDWFGD